MSKLKSEPGSSSLLTPSLLLGNIKNVSNSTGGPSGNSTLERPSKQLSSWNSLERSSKTPLSSFNSLDRSSRTPLADTLERRSRPTDSLDRKSRGSILDSLDRRSKSPNLNSLDRRSKSPNFDQLDRRSRSPITDTLESRPRIKKSDTRADLSKDDSSKPRKDKDEDSSFRPSSRNSSLFTDQKINRNRSRSPENGHSTDLSRAIVPRARTPDTGSPKISRRPRSSERNADRQVAKREKPGRSNTESKHFLSLQLFSTHAEPSIKEFLPLGKQLELETRHRMEEDVLYRTFLEERRLKEPEVNNMSEEERTELFDMMNKKERSRVINLVEKHTTQMMDLIHREKIAYLQSGGEEIPDLEVKYPRDPPPIQPPEFTKEQVYENNMAIFENVDEVAKQATSTKFDSFTSLVRFLIEKFTSELDKARAIFRFMTETEFKYRSWFLYYPEEGNTRGAPTQLFRGVEFGIESKALLFKRLCSYAGLHSVVIQGFSKVKDYKPAEKFVDNRWRNSWNAVYVAGGWRLVHPNWAAMNVNTKALKETKKIYQDHYFLTNPDEFIFEFFPIKEEYQFLDHPIPKDEFENLPVLRCTFFHYGLSLSRNEGLLNAVIQADENGEANIYLKSKEEISYHYSLTTEKGGSSVKVDGERIPLDRFVMMSHQEDEAVFNIHVPQKGEYMLEIGCTRYPSVEDYLNSPISYINVCKFKIVSKKVNKVMVPLPNCVPGEWGPKKALNIFGLKGVSHPLPIIYAAPPSTVDLNTETRCLTLNIEFEKQEPILDFVTKLYKNGVDEKQLKQGARYRNKENYVLFDIQVPQEGQYGLDIYARRNWEDKMLHCCKYLINCDV